MFCAIGKEKHWLLGALITKLIRGIARNKASLDPYLYEYQKMLTLKNDLLFVFSLRLVLKAFKRMFARFRRFAHYS